MTTKRAMAAGHDRKGRFQTGNIGGGRPRGSRNKLGEAFLNDLVSAWDTHGASALETCAKSEPTQFCKLVGSVLPREIVTAAFSLNATVDLPALENAKGFFEAYRYAREKIGAEPAIDLSAEAETAWKMDDPDDD